MEEFVLLLRKSAKILTECGCSSHRLETLMMRLGSSWGFEVDAFAFPTAVLFIVRRDGKRSTEMIRIHNWSVDLQRLDRINQLISGLSVKAVTPAEASAALDEIAAEPPPYSGAITLAAGGTASMALLSLQSTPALTVAATVDARRF